ncbi:septum formation protein [Bacillus ectoiniformans]|uniref:Maf family protein n=1 Tax=Bacillus ectoiniformans TaxID=1494429 RepID=UPI00195B1702|nr:Maf family protein [Bacillus ectoiniformans]MBM7648946.1 septum formation protein [Bacillus ectoiniformans]
MTDIILASGSPRRKELLQQIHLPFTVQTSHVDETISNELSPEDIVTQLAERKARAVAAEVSNKYVIGADTVVVQDGVVLGKPKDRDEARHMLKKLSGHTHAVYTGVAIIHNDDTFTFYEKTNVTFWELLDEDIEAYLDSGEPFDKAGAYGIQGLGAVHVKSIEGDYFSVVGLPIASLYRHLKRLGFNGRSTSSPSEK